MAALAAELGRRLLCHLTGGRASGPQDGRGAGGAGAPTQPVRLTLIKRCSVSLSLSLSLGLLASEFILLIVLAPIKSGAPNELGACIQGREI